MENKNTPDKKRLPEWKRAMADQRPLERRGFLKIGTLIGGSLPLVLTLHPLEARADSSS